MGLLLTMAGRAIKARRRTLLATVLLVAGAACATVPPDPRVTPLLPQLGRLLMVGVPGTEVQGDATVERLLCETRVGGVLLFARNIADPAQITRFTAALRERARRCTGEPLLVAVDAEGGQVMRLGPTAGFSPTLSAEELGQANDLAVTELEAQRIGARLKAGGIDWDLAPVVDVGYNPANPVIVAAGRSFSADPVFVAHHARAFIRGLQAEGVLTALKHFPGHGSSFADSHHGFVDVTDTANLDVELLPYRMLIGERLVDSVMTAHVFNRRLDPRYPATLSRATVTGLLRGELGFNGVVVSDDLRMGAIEQRYGLAKAAVLALQAGVDVLLIADDQLPDGRSAADVAVNAIHRALLGGRLDPDRVAEALRRIRALPQRVGAVPASGSITPSSTRRSGG
jgi:beta-N-acetylhexosaminidase